MKARILLVVGVLAAVAGGVYLVGRMSNGMSPPPLPPAAHPSGPTLTQLPPEPTAVVAGNTADAPPLPAEKAPEPVRDSNLVRQTLQKGKTYQSVLRGTIRTVGTDLAWGIESVVAVNYALEASIDRDIIDNDGAVVVEHWHFRDFRSVKMNTYLNDLHVNLWPAKLPIIPAVAAVCPDGAGWSRRSTACPRRQS